MIEIMKTRSQNIEGRKQNIEYRSQELGITE
jgi:hypothetical protein